MKKILTVILLSSYLFSCNKEDKIPLYGIDNKFEDESILLPLLSKDSFEKLISKKASFPLLIYSPTCQLSCSTFPYELTSYLKESKVFFPFIYESVFSSINEDSIETSIYLYKEGKVIRKTNIDYFNSNDLNSYMNKYSYKNNLTIVNSLVFSKKEDVFNLSYFEENQYLISKEIIKDNDVLLIDDNKLPSFNSEYKNKIKGFKYILFSSFLSDSFYQEFQVEKTNSIYSKLYYSNEKVYLDSY